MERGAVGACAARPGCGRPDRSPVRRRGRSARAAASVPGRVLGRRRRRRSRAIRCSSRRSASACSRCCRPEPGPSAAPMPGQGTDRPGVRRARVLGHRGLRSAAADLHRARGRCGRAALAALDPRPGPGAGRHAGPVTARRSLADHPRRGVLGVLAGRHGGAAPQRGASPAPSSATGSVTGDSRWSASAGWRLLVETARLWVLAGHHDTDGGWHLDGVTGPDEYSSGRRRQRLHQSDGRPEPARRRRVLATASLMLADRLGVTRAELDAVANGGRRRARPLRRAAGCAPSVGGLHPVRAAGTSTASRGRLSR